jgi:formate hydrogenlyase subunit 3/multisubunit Na+/H+ antiporter MnhD subunit
MSYLVALAFLAILASLAAALFFMLRGGQSEAPDKSKRMARALAMRVGFSVLLFLCILLSWKMGWIHPTGIGAGQ